MGQKGRLKKLQPCLPTSRLGGNQIFLSALLSPTEQSKLFSAMTGTCHPKSMEIARPLWDQYFAILLNDYLSSSLPCSSCSRKGCPFHAGMHDA